MGSGRAGADWTTKPVVSAWLPGDAAGTPALQKESAVAFRENLHFDQLSNQTGKREIV